MTQLSYAFLMVGIGGSGLLVGFDTDMPVTATVGAFCVAYGLITAAVLTIKRKVKR